MYRVVRRNLTVGNIPVIDISRNSRAVALDIRQAASSVGFFQIVQHGVPGDVIREAYDQLQWFFSLPTEVKMQLHTSKVGGIRGYIGMFEQGNYGMDETDQRQKLQNLSKEERIKKLLKDAKEVFTLGTELDASHPLYVDVLYARNVWPAEEHFRNAIEKYYANLWQLSRKMFRLFAHSLDLEEEFFDDKVTETPMNSLNCIHYPPFDVGIFDQVQLGIGEHTDFECFTLLSQGDVSGLEILTNDGQWTQIPCIENAFVVNIGDMVIYLLFYGQRSNILE